MFWTPGPWSEDDSTTPSSALHLCPAHLPGNTAKTGPPPFPAFISPHFVLAGVLFLVKKKISQEIVSLKQYL